MFASTAQEKMSEHGPGSKLFNFCFDFCYLIGFGIFDCLWLGTLLTLADVSCCGSPSVLPYEVGLGWALSPPVYQLFSDVPLLDREEGVI